MTDYEINVLRVIRGFPKETERFRNGPWFRSVAPRGTLMSSSDTPRNHWGYEARGRAATLGLLSVQ